MKRKAPFLTYVHDNIPKNFPGSDIGYAENKDFAFDPVTMITASYKVIATYSENVYFEIYIIDTNKEEHYSGYIYIKNYTGILDDVAIKALQATFEATEKAIRDIKVEA